MNLRDTYRDTKSKFAKNANDDDYFGIIGVQRKHTMKITQPVGFSPMNKN